MYGLKTVGVCAGIAFGSVIGGTVSLVGKLTNAQFIDELGNNILDSAILTGEITGQAASGTVDIIRGKWEKSPRRLKKGKQDLKQAGSKIVINLWDNCRLIQKNSGEIVAGLYTHDPKRVKNGAKTLGKVIAVSFVTVGAIQIDAPSNSPHKRQ